jgi:hypothetical protein
MPKINSLYLNDDVLTLFVTKEGNDSWNGMKSSFCNESGDGSLATIQGAVDKIKGLKQLGELYGPVQVLIKEGTYELSNPITITSEASWPTTFEPCSGDKVVVKGGRTINCFTEKNINGINMWIAELPEVKEGNWYFRELFVNGERRGRTRLPKKGFYWMKEIPGIDLNLSCWLQLSNGTDSFVFNEGDIKSFYDMRSVDIIAHHFWVDERMPIESIDMESKTYLLA